MAMVMERLKVHIPTVMFSNGMHVVLHYVTIATDFFDL